MSDYRITFDGFDESEVAAIVTTLGENGIRTENFEIVTETEGN